MTAPLLWSGWAAAAALAVAVIRLRRRLELVARAEHELRGPLTAFSLALDAARGTSAGRRLALVLDSELARARAGLADLAAARAGHRAAPEPSLVDVDRLLRSSAAAWGARVRGGVGPALVRADRSRVASVLGNVLSNAAEHGAGDVAVDARRLPDRVRVEVTNPVRGRGLEIAAAAAADAGGTLATEVGAHRAKATLDLPLEP